MTVTFCWSASSIPAGVVRKEYQAYQLATKDGRVLSGLIVEQTPQTIILRDAKGAAHQSRRARRWKNSRSRMSH